MTNTVQRSAKAPSSSDGSKSAITVEGLTKDFATTRAVDQLSFEIPAGGVTGFVGPNGSGKSTTFRMLLGLIRPTAGNAWTTNCREHDRGSAPSDLGSVPNQV